MIDIIGLTIAAVIYRSKDTDEVVFFGHIKRKWLAIFLDMPDGILSHDTTNRVFSLLGPEILQTCFLNWVQGKCQYNRIKGRIIAIGGKRFYRSGQDRKKAVVHMVSARCNTNYMVMAHVKTEAKSNVITSIPDLLNIINRGIR